MRQFWQWLCGYVCVCVRGRQVNRFMNLCSRNGIRLWRIKHEMEQSLRVNIRLKDFYDIKPYLRKTKTRIRIIAKKGFPFWCHRHPRLKWFFCICFFVLCIGIYSLNYVWNIEIKGNEKVSTQEIIDYLQDNSINIGLKKENVDCPEIELLLREKYQQLGWVSVYLQDTNLCVEVKESLYDSVEHSDIEDYRMYNLVANKDAIISSMVTRAGKAVVKEGQSVRKGDVLVLGQSEIFEDSGELREILYFKADALIYGDVVYEIDIPLTEIEILSLKIADKYSDRMLLNTGQHKLNAILDRMQENGVIILNYELKIEKNEKNICFRAKIYAREQIGINTPAEEVAENEFE